jgi:hypothetical protein
MAGTPYGECDDLVNQSNGFGIVVVAPNGDNGLDITVEPPVFTTFGPITIEGTWPNFRVTVTPGTGGSIYSFNSGAGVEVTGGPNDFTFGLKPTGITPGDYGPVTFNAFGQATAVGQIVSGISAVAPLLSTLDPQTGLVSLEIAPATTSAPGIVELYDSVGVSPYPTDVAATPNAVKQIIDAELAALGGISNSSVYTLTVPAPPATVDAANFGNSALLSTSGLIQIPAGETRSISALIELNAAQAGFAFVVERSTQDVLGFSPLNSSAMRFLVGEISGPFSNELEVRFFNPATPTVPSTATLSSISMVVA